MTQALYGLPEGMRNEIMELAKSHPYPVEVVEQYYLMGGKEHAELLLQARAGLLAKRIPNDQIEVAIRILSNDIYQKNNKSLEELLGG